MFFYEETSHGELVKALFSCGSPPTARKLLHAGGKKCKYNENQLSSLTDLIERTEKNADFKMLQELCTLSACGYRKTVPKHFC